MTILLWPFWTILRKSPIPPLKGDARYFSIITKNKPIENVAWFHETPAKEILRLKQHLAFYPNEKIAIEHLE